MNTYQKYDMMKCLYYEGDERVDRCFLCGSYEYISDMRLILGKHVCDCNEGQEDTEELVQKEIDAHERRVAKCKEAIDMRTLANDILGSVNVICKDYKQNN